MDASTATAQLFDSVESGIKSNPVPAGGLALLIGQALFNTFYKMADSGTCNCGEDAIVFITFTETYCKLCWAENDANR